MDILGRSLHNLVAVASLLVLMLLSACTGQQNYRTGQDWQRSECSKISNTQERSRCMAVADMSYEEYTRQHETSQGAK